MTKKQLSEIAGSLRDQAEALKYLAELLEGKETAGEPQQKPTVEKAPTAQEPKVTLEQVRAVLAEKSRAGLTEKVRELILRHGADRLSAVNPSEYAALLAEAEAL